MTNGLSQRQVTGEVVEIPSPALHFVETARWQPIASLKARLEGRDPCEPNDPPCKHQDELFGKGGPIADPHWYTILGWGDQGPFTEFARIVRDLGYDAYYTIPYPPHKRMLNQYLEIGSYVYWYIWPRQLCRTRIEWGQREVVPVQETLRRSRSHCFSSTSTASSPRMGPSPRAGER